MDVSRDWVKSFGFRGNIVGSWQIQVAFAGTQFYQTVAEGTFPASTGSITVRSFENAARMARARVRLSAAGSASISYGGLAPFVR